MKEKQRKYKQIKSLRFATFEIYTIWQCQWTYGQQHQQNIYLNHDHETWIIAYTIDKVTHIIQHLIYKFDIFQYG